MANIQKFSVQCVLVINMFNEKIFVAVWWIFFVAFFLTLANLIWWIRFVASSEAQMDLVRSVLVSERVRETRRALSDYRTPLRPS